MGKNPVLRIIWQLHPDICKCKTINQLQVDSKIVTFCWQGPVGLDGAPGMEGPSGPRGQKGESGSVGEGYQFLSRDEVTAR